MTVKLGCLIVYGSCYGIAVLKNGGRSVKVFALMGDNALSRDIGWIHISLFFYYLSSII